MFLPRREPHVAHHRPVLLSEAGDIDNRYAETLQVGCHAKQRTERDDAGTADSRNEDSVRSIERVRDWGGHACKGVLAHRHRRCASTHGPAVDCYKARAEALETGVILVAAGLIDLPLAAERRLHRHDGDAARLFRTIPAALAYRFIDEDSLGRIGRAAALAAAPLLGRASLIVNKRGKPRDRAKLALDGIELVTVTDIDALWQTGAPAVFAGLVGHDDDPFCAFGQNLLRDLRHGRCAFDRLAAGHGDGIVVE